MRVIYEDVDPAAALLSRCSRCTVVMMKLLRNDPAARSPGLCWCCLCLCLFMMSVLLFFAPRQLPRGNSRADWRLNFPNIRSTHEINFCSDVSCVLSPFLIPAVRVACRSCSSPCSVFTHTSAHQREQSRTDLPPRNASRAADLAAS